MKFDMEDDSPKEECGVIGVFAPNEDVARMTFFGLYALQHRGQEAAGMAVANDMPRRAAIRTWAPFCT